jgi:hypothetical protein
MPIAKRDSDSDCEKLVCPAAQPLLLISTVVVCSLILMGAASSAWTPMYSATDDTSLEYQTVAVTVAVPAGRSPGNDHVKVSFFAFESHGVNLRVCGNVESRVGPGCSLPGYCGAVTISSSINEGGRRRI